MDRPKTSPEKKALSYTRDHIVNAEYRQGFPEYWNKKKAQANRKFRRQVNQALDEQQDALAADPLEEVSADTIRRDRVRKVESSQAGPPIPLGIWVQDRLHRRIERTAYNFFKQPYTSARHRDRFAALLQTIVQGRTAYSRSLALHFQDLLDPSSPYSSSAWLEAFFQDEPQWKERLHGWIVQLGR